MGVVYANPAGINTFLEGRKTEANLTLFQERMIKSIRPGGFPGLVEAVRIGRYGPDRAFYNQFDI